MSADPKPAYFLVFLLASCLLATGVRDVRAGDIKTGLQKAMMCQACHGLDGLSKTPDAPNIAGQLEPYLIAQLHAFKSGERKSELMSVVVSSLSDEDIENLAAYFSAIEVQVVKLPNG
jgi:cytochrome c553